MKILHTFWTGPSNRHAENLFCMKAGWRSSEYHWMSWALSCLQAKAIFGNIHLVTDDRGKDILVDILQLPYTSVTTELQRELKDNHPDTWALAKLYAYSIQDEPFLHIDGDVILWKHPGDDFLASPLFAQNLDKNLTLYAQTLNQINQHFTYLPEPFTKHCYEGKDIYASNAGLIGGNDFNFFKGYAKQAFDFITNNAKYLDRLSTGDLNFIFEQYLFYELATAQGTPISYYKPMMDQHVFNEYIRFEDYPYIDMVHPVGNFKKYQHVCDHLSRILRKDYPEYYYRIIEAVRNENKTMRSAIYYSPQLKIDALTETTVSQKFSLPAYQRTLAAIDLLNNSGIATRRITLDDLGDKDKMNNLIADKAKKDCLLDIYRLETKMVAIAKKLYQKRVTSLYNENMANYALTQQCFSLQEAELLNIEFITSKDIRSITLGWIWEYDFPEEIPTVVGENLDRAKSRYVALLVPQVMQLTIRDAYPDELEILIISMAAQPVSFANALTTLAQYFPIEEIEHNYNSFKRLIFDTIKRLLYFEIVKININ